MGNILRRCGRQRYPPNLVTSGDTIYTIPILLISPAIYYYYSFTLMQIMMSCICVRACDSITSYNEWGEGTQIESARKVSPAENMGKDYLDYGDRGPFKYIHIAAEYASVFLPQQETLSSSVIELREGQEVEESEEATAEEVMREDGEAEENTVQVEEEGDSKASGIIGASSDGKDDASDTRESGSFSPLDDNNNGEGSDVGVDSPEDDVARSNNEL